RRARVRKFNAPWPRWSSSASASPRSSPCSCCPASSALCCRKPSRIPRPMIETWAFALAFAFAVPGPPPSRDLTANEQSIARRKIKLDEVVEHAREQAGRALLSEAEIQRGAAAEAAAQPLLPGNPNLQVLLGGRRNPNGSNWEGQFQLNQPIAIAGQRRFRRAAATRQREALEQQYARFQWEAEVETRTAFHPALLAQRRVDSAVTTAHFLEQVV